MNKGADCLNCIYLKDFSGKHCNTCKSVYESINKDEPVKVKQLIFNFSYKYGYTFDFKENIIELYLDEFKFYQTPNDIEIDPGFGIYQLTVELFVPSDSTKEDINQIKIQVKEAMENWFKDRIKDLTHGLEVLKDDI